MEFKLLSSLLEAVNKEGYHTSLNDKDGVFAPYGKGTYLHDKSQKSGGGDGPMLVTVQDPELAKTLAKQFGGKVRKTTFGTFRIVK